MEKQSLAKQTAVYLALLGFGLVLATGLFSWLYGAEVAPEWLQATAAIANVLLLVVIVYTYARLAQIEEQRDSVSFEFLSVGDREINPQTPHILFNAVIANGGLRDSGILAATLWIEGSNKPFPMDVYSNVRCETSDSVVHAGEAHWFRFVAEDAITPFGHAETQRRRIRVEVQPVIESKPAIEDVP